MADNNLQMKFREEGQTEYPGEHVKENQSDEKGNDSDEGADTEKKKSESLRQGAIVMEKPNIKWSDGRGLCRGASCFLGRPALGRPTWSKPWPQRPTTPPIFSVSLCDLVSKWLGENEKLVKSLFLLARKHGPSIIFIDEIDFMCCSRGENESEAVRRVRNEFLVQMRQQRQRRQPRAGGHQRPLDPGLCHQTKMTFCRVRGSTWVHPDQVVDDLWTPRSPGDTDAVEMTWMDIQDDKLKEPVVSMADMLKSLSGTKLAVNEQDLEKLKQFMEDFGQEG
ncbi:hypothetical protein AGOR_G00142670 [Albula goreensis]|uniref:ATPase AAA-type core domain-containing protein n=1 Tax=Albula goreensis TaxID=1534307 RepID=A0A8T3D973_9TELE|nr:hypothetical protein AGOR_G00142670 [Albula goreensis]